MHIHICYREGYGIGQGIKPILVNLGRGDGGREQGGGGGGGGIKLVDMMKAASMGLSEDSDVFADCGVCNRRTQRLKCEEAVVSEDCTGAIINVSWCCVSV